MDERISEIYNAAAYISGRLQGRKPLVGIVLGSGLGQLADSIEDRIVIPYVNIPGFPIATATGHKGNLICGTLGGKTVLAMQGRFHFYEGYPMSQVTLPIRVMISLGISYLFVSNAAGGVRQSFNVGDLMIISDHINLLPNPLIGRNMDEFGPRFPDMTHPYDPGLIERARGIADDLGIEVTDGVYIAGTGPSYETTAEYKYFHMIGADAVGMSTIPEVIVARHCGVPVFGVSVITNVRKFDGNDPLNDADEVIAAGLAAGDRLCRLFTKLIESL